MERTGSGARVRVIHKRLSAPAQGPSSRAMGRFWEQKIVKQRSSGVRQPTLYCRVAASPTFLQADEKVSLSAPRLLSLEEAIGYVSGSELVEVTPTAVRVRKEVLDATQRKVQAKKEASY